MFPDKIKLGRECKQFQNKLHKIIPDELSVIQQGKMMRENEEGNEYWRRQDGD